MTDLVEVLARALYEAAPEWDSGEAIDGHQVTPAGPLPWTFMVEMDHAEPYREAARDGLTALEAAGYRVVPAAALGSLLMCCIDYDKSDMPDDAEPIMVTCGKIRALVTAPKVTP